MACFHPSRRFLRLLGLLGSGMFCCLVYCLAQRPGCDNPRPRATDQVLKVRFYYAGVRNSILLHVKINDKPARLIVDTGSRHTVLRPEILNMNPSELTLPNRGSSGAGFIGDAVGKDVSLQVGDWRWPKRRIAVMDLSEVLAAYREQIDGVLGLDFFQEFTSVTINMKEKTISFIR